MALDPPAADDAQIRRLQILLVLDNLQGAAVAEAAAGDGLVTTSQVTLLD